MARPTKPKTMKPKADDAEAPDKPEKITGSTGGSSGMDTIKFAILLVVIVLSSIGGSMGSLYFLAPMVLGPTIESALSDAAINVVQHQESHGEHGGHGAPAMSLELDEFTVNLKKDPSAGGVQYLRSKMTLGVEVPHEENCHVPHEGEGEGGGGHGGGHGGGGGGGDPCQDAFNKSMAPYVPGIRDIINSALMKRTAGTLSTPEGQETLKDEIQRDVNGLLESSHYKIERVNLQDFIIQY